MIYAFVGKGGVGKTTIASAFALNMAGSGKTAIVSSDFMPSLKFLFPEDVKNLTVIELTEKEVAESWKERYGHEVDLILRQFVDVDEWIIDHVANSPGVAEEFMISNIVNMELSGKFDNVIWDTAASSSTMHLLILEKEFYQHLDNDIKIYLKLRDRFHSEKVMNLLEEWKELAVNVWNNLVKSKFILVTTPNELSLLQAKEITDDLRGMGMNVTGTIYNRNREKTTETGIYSVPELDGSAREIVQKARKYLPVKL
jgi:arsenite-transporting ATPase